MSLIQYLRNALTPEQRAVIGQEAKQALENKHWREAFEAVGEYLEEVAQSCDPDNKDKALRVILSKQLLTAIKRELVRKIEDGEIAQVEMSELERKSVRKFFR